MLPNILRRSFKQCYNLNEKLNEVDKKPSHDGFCVKYDFQKIHPYCWLMYKIFLNKD